MKKFKWVSSVIIAAIIALSAFTVFAESTTYKIDELNMEMSIPNEMITVTRDSKRSDAFFSIFELDYEDTMASLESASIYLQSIKENGSLTLTVTMSKDKNSAKIDNYARMKDSEVKAIMNKYLNDKAYKSGNIVKSNGITYISLSMSAKSGKKTIHAQQYCTVVNGMNIVVTLDAPAGKKLTSDDKEMLTDVINNTFIADNNFFEKNKDILIYGGVTLFGLLVVAVVLIVLLKKLKNPNRKHKHLVHELAHEHRISETTQIPRKKSIQNITKPTMSFLKNYKPLDEIEKKSKKKEAAPEKEPTAEPLIEDIPESKEPKPEKKEKKNSFEYKEKPLETLKKASATSEPTKVIPNKTIKNAKKQKREVPLAEKIVSSSSKKTSEPVEEVPIAAPMEFTEKKKEKPRAKQDIDPESELEAEVVETADDKKSNKVDAYFEEVPEKKNMFAYSDVDTAVDEYNAAKEESRLIREESMDTRDTIMRILKAIGNGILTVLQAIWTAICYIVIHIKYLCVNVFRTIKKNRADKKRMKIEEERRRAASEQRRRQREAERARQRQNANRNEGDLVKMRSSEERRPVNRTAYPRNRRPAHTSSPNRSQRQGGRPPQRQTGRPPQRQGGRPPQGRRPRGY